MRRWSPSGLASAAVLATWAGAFWVLLVTGRSALYLSTRTRWVIPVGAVALSAAAFGRVWAARGPSSEPLPFRRALGLGVVVLPAVVVLALPPTALDSYAASRRSSFVGAGYVAAASDVASGSLTLLDVAGAESSRAGRQALAGRAGQRVSFVGFVTRYADTAADEFFLNRFIITCCVADALAAQVRVVDAPPGRFRQDQWVRVTGHIYPVGSEVIVDAEIVQPVARPGHPYLSP